MHNEKSRMVALMGVEGSGKSTLAHLLADETGLPYISTGDMIRELAKEDQGKMGAACRSMLEEHTYLAPELMIQIITNRLSRDDVKNGFVLDGGFRLVEESRAWEQIFKDAGLELGITVIFLRVPIWEAAQRLVERGRDDDTPEGIKSRMENFYSHLGERMSIVRENGWDIIIIQAHNRPVEEISEEINQRLVS